MLNPHMANLSMAFQISIKIVIDARPKFASAEWQSKHFPHQNGRNGMREISNEQGNKSEIK
jgi:hypothetical protein